MDFKDLQKVWNQQTNEPMYIIDQQALYRQVRRRASQADRIARTNEWGIMIIAVLTSVMLRWVGSDTAYQIVASEVMLGADSGAFWQRLQHRALTNPPPCLILAGWAPAITNAT